MARARVSINLTPHELAYVVDAMRIYSQVIESDLGLAPAREVHFNNAVCDGNWHMGLITVEDIRSQLGDGDVQPPEIQPRRASAKAPTQRKKKGRSAVSQARRANRTGKKLLRFLGV